MSTEDDWSRAARPLERAWTLPPAAYKDPAVFQREIERIFMKDWICVARHDQVTKPGDFVCFDLPELPGVLVRDMAGNLHALSRICLHRSMPLMEGRGNSTRFVCPYHHWSYELGGRLRSAPMMDGVEGFEPDRCRLPRLGVEVWQGFVFVNPDTQAEPLAPQLEPLASRLENYEFSRMVVMDSLDYPSAYNWKILVENFMEAYHHIGTHKDTFQPVYPAKDSFVEDNGDGPWTMLRMPGIREEAEGCVFPKLDHLQRSELFAACVFPTLLFAASAGGAFWYQLAPESADRMHLRIHFLALPESAAGMTAEDRAGVMEGVRLIHAEDIAANEGVWAGLNSGMTRQGRLSQYEKAIWQLNQLWLKRMSGGVAGMCYGSVTGL